MSEAIITSEEEIRSTLNHLWKRHDYTMVTEPNRMYMKGFIHPSHLTINITTEWFIESGASGSFGFDISDVYQIYYEKGSYWVVKLYQRIDVKSEEAL